MRNETIPYRINGQEFIGHLAVSDVIEGKRPAIIIAHAWRGLDEFAQEKAKILAEMGYVAFAADLYGNGKVAKDDQESLALMMPLFLDRSMLQKRIAAAFDVVSRHPLVETSKIGAIGFCFGGLTVIELLRSGAPVKGVVSFHGVLGNQIGDKKAKTVPIGSNIKGSLLILHGHDDPLASDADIKAIQKEMTDANVDWQMNIYGHTMHAFTNPIAQDPKGGKMYNPLSARRAWHAMDHFFEEIF